MPILLRDSLNIGRTHSIVPEERRRTLNAFHRLANQARRRLGVEFDCVS